MEPNRVRPAGYGFRRLLRMFGHNTPSIRGPIQQPPNENTVRALWDKRRVGVLLKDRGGGSPGRRLLEEFHESRQAHVQTVLFPDQFEPGLAERAERGCVVEHPASLVGQPLDVEEVGQ